MKRLLFLLIPVVLFSACQKQIITISGTLDHGAGKTIYIEELTPGGPLFLDSVKLDDKGHFRVRYDMPYKTFYNVHVNGYDYVVLQPDYGEHVEIAGDYDSLTRTYTVKGAGDSQLLWQLQQSTNQANDVLMRIGSADRQRRQQLEAGTLSQAEFDQAHRATDSVFLATYCQQQDYIFQFIEQHKGSLATIIALYKPFNANMPLVDPKKHNEYYQLVLQGLEESLPDNPHTANFRTTVQQIGFQYVEE